jgi:hypothetical protein
MAQDPGQQDLSGADGQPKNLSTVHSTWSGSGMGDQGVMVADKMKDGDKATFLVPANASCWWGGGIFGVEERAQDGSTTSCH